MLASREIVLAAGAKRLAAEELRADRANVLAAVQTQTCFIPGLPWLASRIYWYLQHFGRAW